ncbi:MAG: ATP-binding protein [Thermodesulfovibrionales bacterium]
MQGKESIRKKLIRVNLIAFGVAFLLITAALMLEVAAAFKRHMVTTLETQAALIGKNSTAALSFNDAKAAEEILSSLGGVPSIEQAVMYSREGAVFARYLRSGAQSIMPAESIVRGRDRGNRHAFAGGRLHVFYPIVLAGETIGTLYLRSDLEGLYSLVLKNGSTIVLIASFSLIASFLLLSRLQKKLTVPLFDLFGVMQRVSRTKEYSLRVPLRSNDELGTLAAGLNEMLEQIEKWGNERETHRLHLEETVSLRTAELEAANRRLQEELSERIRTAEELKGKTEELAQTSEDLRFSLESEKRFLTIMSHEIRTPLNAVIGFTDILLTTTLDDYQSRLLSNSQKSAHHLLSLINDMLDVSKIEAGQLELKSDYFNLAELLEECLTIVSSSSARKVEWIHAVPPMDFFVRGDSLRIKQIFLNLLGNAAKFTEQGHIRLFEVSRTEAPSGGTIFLFCVEDSGVGIPRERIGSLFAPFRQVHSLNYGGTGLGLYLSRSLARMMGGDITVESSEGKGSNFYVGLTLQTAPKTAPGKKEHQDEHSLKERYRHLRILVAEDVEMNVLVIKELFRRFFSIEPDIARDGNEAVAMACAGRYDLIFMDIQMPHLDGIAAARAIRAAGVATPIVALSAHALSDDIESARRSGMDDYITKPVKRDNIGRMLRKFTGEGDSAHDNARTPSEAVSADRREQGGTLREKALRYFITSFGGDEAGARHLLRSSVDSVRTEVRAIESALASGSTGDLERALHSMKGVLLNSGLTEQGELAATLNVLARTGEAPGKVKAGAEELLGQLASYLQ